MIRRDMIYSTASGLNLWFRSIGCVLLLCFIVTSCRTTKSKDEAKGLSKLYQNMTAHYNGYFNATEIMKESIYTLDQEHKDNFNQILPVYEYAAVDDPKTVSANMDKAIKKASVVISVHRPSKWTDDCYLLIGQAQYIKQDFESAQKTLEYLTNNFDKYGKSKEKVKKEKKLSKYEARQKRIDEIKAKRKEIEEKRKAAAKDRKELEKEKKEAREQLQKERKATSKAKAKSRKELEKERKQQKKERDKERKRIQKEREKARKLARKGKSLPVTTTTPKSNDSPVEPSTSDETAKPEEAPAKKSLQERMAEREERKRIEAEKKAKQQEEEQEKEEITPLNEKDEKVKNGGLAHIPAHFAAQLWLARTYVERDFLIQAERIFRTLENDPDVSDEVRDALYPALAHHYIKSEEYQLAIEALEKAIERESKRQIKARYIYIIGQLQEKLNNHQGAIASFDQAAKWSNDYAMVFNAKLNSEIAAMKGNGKSTDDLLKSLDKLSQDDKNAEFLDQIYLQTAMVYLNIGDEQQAKLYLQKALGHVTQPAQRVEIYYTLGEIHYNKDQFADAYEAYNSAFSSMKKSDKRYADVKAKVAALKNVAKYQKDLNLQDSLFMLASLSDEELKERAANIKKEREAKLEEARQLVAMEKGISFQQGATGLPPSLRGIEEGPIATSSKVTTTFFAYDEKAKRDGERDFAKQWGRRALVDDWRRIEENEVVQDLEDKPQANSTLSEVTNKEVEDIFSGLPRTEEQIASGKQKIADALFGLGMSYRHDMARLDLSSQAFTRFVEEAPEADERRPQVYYFLYLNARDQGDLTKAEHMAMVLKNKFPDTKYALLANDPEYINTLLSEAASAETFYQATYAAFEAGDYARVYDAYDQAHKEFGADEPLMAKFALLRAMTVGQRIGQAAYIEALRQVVAQYPNTPEQIKAREIIRFLSGTDEAFNTNWDATANISDYKINKEDLHYVIIVLYNDEMIDLQEAKIKVSDYNRTFHQLENLTIRSFIVDRDKMTQAILVRKFANQQMALSYTKKASDRMSELLPEGADAEVFAISQSNYRTMFKDGNIQGYKVFYNNNVLED